LSYVGSVAHQSAGFRILAKWIDHGQSIAGGRYRELNATLHEQRIAGDEERIELFLGEVS
jgi:hypothetical protein